MDLDLSRKCSGSLPGRRIDTANGCTDHSNHDVRDVLIAKMVKTRSQLENAQTIFRMTIWSGLQIKFEVSQVRRSYQKPSERELELEFLVSVDWPIICAGMTCGPLSESDEILSPSKLCPFTAVIASKTSLNSFFRSGFVKPIRASARQA